jgi:predicted transcriptional regulator
MKNRAYRRMQVKKNYFVMSDEILQLYRCREISAIDVRVYSYLCSLRIKYKGVQVSQRRIASICGITEKTVRKSVYRLFHSGLIERIIIETQKHKIKYKTSVYVLKPLPDSGFFFCSRFIFMNQISHKAFAAYLFMCDSHSFEYGKSWNSYNDVCVQLGFGKNQRSEVVALIGELVMVGLVKKTIRKIKGIFVDNIYRVGEFDNISHKHRFKEKHPVTSRVQFKKSFEKKILTSVIIPPFAENVKPHYMQCRFDF